MESLQSPYLCQKRRTLISWRVQKGVTYKRHQFDPNNGPVRCCSIWNRHLRSHLSSSRLLLLWPECKWSYKEVHVRFKVSWAISLQWFVFSSLFLKNQALLHPASSWEHHSTNFKWRTLNKSMCAVFYPRLIQPPFLLERWKCSIGIKNWAERSTTTLDHGQKSEGELD